MNRLTKNEKKTEYVERFATLNLIDPERTHLTYQDTRKHKPHNQHKYVHFSFRQPSRTSLLSVVIGLLDP